MSEELQWPKFGPVDPEGFRTFSLHTNEGELLRLSIHLERHRECLNRTAGDLAGEFSSDEREHLRIAAAIAAAHKKGKERDPERALAKIIDLTNEYSVRDMEKHFPLFAMLALEVAAAVCVKRTLNTVVHSLRAPRIYNEAWVDELLENLTRKMKRFLNVGVGRPAETLKQVQDICEAIRRIDKKKRTLRDRGKKPTQRQIVDELSEGDPNARISRRTLRKWAEACGLSWNEYLSMCLRMCGWMEAKAERN